MLSLQLGVRAIPVTRGNTGHAWQQRDVVPAILVHCQKHHAGNLDLEARHVAAQWDVWRYGLCNEGVWYGVCLTLVL